MTGWVVAIIAAVLAAVGAYAAGNIHGQSTGYDRAIAERAAADAKAELERKGDDAKLKTLDPYDLCVAGLRGNGMPVDACEQLRGTSEK